MFYIQGGWKVSRLNRTVIIPIIIYKNSVHIRLTIEDNGKKELNFHIDTSLSYCIENKLNVPGTSSHKNLIKKIWRKRQKIWINISSHSI